MTVTIVGSQLGDEGKGGAVDLYGEAADVVVRYQGGDNAGHTVVFDGEEYKLSLLPSGVVRGKVGVIGNGYIVNPETLFDELDALRERGLDPDDEAAEELATYIRDEGGEYGTVTGRPRRVGWLDLPMLRHAARTNGFTGLVVGHIDVLAGLDKVKVGHSDQFEGEELQTVPPTTEKWSRCTANYRRFDGWPEVDWSEVAREGYDAIPENARPTKQLSG